MEPTPELLRQLRREEIEDARRMSEKSKLEAGGDLFDMAALVTLSGIRADKPGISEESALRELERRLELARRLESRV